MHPVKFLKIFCLVVIASCGRDDARPGDLLSEDKMVQVMTDVHIFEAMMQGKKMSNDSLAIFTATNYDVIFKKHGIQKEQFHRTLTYYEHNPGKMDEMMTKVINELSAMEAKTKAEVEKGVRNKSVADSLQNSQDPNDAGINPAMK